MEFKQGMLGVVIVGLALVGALFGNYLAGVEASQYEVTKYSYLADVSGLFDYDQSPQYITYDPSSNYTGYYSEESYSAAMDKYYFAEDDVSYTPNTDGRDPPNIRPNNYKVSLEPTVYSTTTIDLTTLSPATYDGIRIMYVYAEGDTINKTVSWEGRPYTIKQIVDGLNISTNATLRIDLGVVDWDKNPEIQGVSGITIDAQIFVPTTWVPTTGNKNVYVMNPSLNPDNINSHNNTLHIPYQSLIVDVQNNLVTAYRGANYTDTNPQSYTMDTMLVCFGTNGGLIPISYLDLDTDMPYQLIINQPASYLDPNYGVALKEEEE